MAQGAGGLGWVEWQALQVGPFGSLSAPCQEAVLWRVAEAVLMPPGSTGNATPLHLCALNESCLWEWLAQWDLMMRMSDKLESLLCEGMDEADGDAAEGVYRNLALRYAAQLEECCQLLYGEQVAAEPGIQSDGPSAETAISSAGPSAWRLASAMARPTSYARTAPKAKPTSA